MIPFFPRRRRSPAQKSQDPDIGINLPPRQFPNLFPSFPSSSSILEPGWLVWVIERKEEPRPGRLELNGRFQIWASYI